MSSDVAVVSARSTILTEILFHRNSNLYKMANIANILHTSYNYIQISGKTCKQILRIQHLKQLELIIKHYVALF